MNFFDLKTGGPSLIRKAILYYHQERRDLTVSVLPLTVQINTGNKCNLKCPLCPTGRGEAPKRKDLDIENFRIIVEKLSFVKKILLFGWGEPLLNRDIFEIITLAKRYNKYVAIHSNLNILNEEKLVKLVGSGLDLLSVSLDGISQETYSKYRVGGNFNLTINNIKKIQQFKAKYGEKKPYIEWQYCVNKYNEDYIEIAKRQATRLRVKIRFIPIGLYLEAINKPNTKSATEWLPVKQIEVFKGRKSLSNPITQKKYCHDLYHFPFIDTDGSVYLCCFAAVATSKNSLINDEFIACAGNLKENDLSEIFNNYVYQHSRSLFSNKKMKLNNIKTICDICRLYKKS